MLAFLYSLDGWLRDGIAFVYVVCAVQIIGFSVVIFLCLHRRALQSWRGRGVKKDYIWC